MHVRVNAGVGVCGLQLDVTHPCHLHDVLIRVLTGKSHSDGVAESLIKRLFTAILSRLKEIHKQW